MDNNVSKIVEKFLDSLEKKVLDLHLQVENYKAKNIGHYKLNNGVISSANSEPPMATTQPRR